MPLASGACDFIVIEAAEVDVPRPAMPNAPRP